MYVDNAAVILIIILSVTLTVFLIVATIFAIWAIRLAKQLNVVALKAEEVVDNVEVATESLKKIAVPLAAGKFMSNIFEMLKNRKG